MVITVKTFGIRTVFKKIYVLESERGDFLTIAVYIPQAFEHLISKQHKQIVYDVQNCIFLKIILWLLE